MPTTPVSPKVTAGINWGIIATLAVGVLTSVTPDMLSGLGPYQSMVFVLIGSAITALRAYLTADPLRDAGLEALTVAKDQPETPAAPASVFPAAAVASAEAEPAEVTPVFTPPAV
jgi:hypothetical protein